MAAPKPSNSESPSHEDDHRDSLMTHKSLAISISAPRCPPYYTAQRSWMLGGRPNPDRDPYVVVATADGMVSTSAGSNEAHSAYHHSNQQQYQRRHEYLVDRLLYHKNTKTSRREHRLRRKQRASDNVLRHHPHWQAEHGLFSSVFPTNPSTGPLQISDSITRLLSSVWSLEKQNRFRDSGGFRRVSDGLVTATIPLAAVLNPTALLAFGRLTMSQKRLVYGTDDESIQFIDLFFPSQFPQTRGMIIFVHGGAWGSGRPWFYRLVALPFLKIGFAVAIVGYRIYPMGDVNVQVRDIGLAYDKLCFEYPDILFNRRNENIDNSLGGTNGNAANNIGGTVLVGHSSGAHIAMLWVVERLKHIVKTKGANERQRMVDAFVGISGPYNVSHHFDYEAARGVEEISPLKAANGLTRDQLRKNSPANRLLSLLADVNERDQEMVLEQHFPMSLFIHGIEDDTVPFTATSEIMNILRLCGLEDKCYEQYVPSTGHQDAVVHLMLGGRVQDAVLDWLSREQNPQDIANQLLRSKL